MVASRGRSKQRPYAERMSETKTIRVAVIGVGDFGRKHARVYRSLDSCELVAVVDHNADRAAKVAAEFATEAVADYRNLAGRVDAVSVAVPTVEHARIGCALMEQGIDVLVEKPMAVSLAEADQLLAAAQKHGRILQVGHLERFNPAVVAVRPVIVRPLFFEVHRLGIFTPRSLDIDVVFDVMIHDLDILLSLVNAPVTDLKAVGIPVVASSHPSMDEAAGDAAVRADPDDAAAIAAAIGEAHERREELVAKGLAHARRFTWRAAGETFLAGYEEAAK